MGRATGVLAAVQAKATATVETAAGMVSRAFAASVVSGDFGALTPAVLALAGRQLIHRGEFVAAIDVIAGRVVLTPAAGYDVTGGHDPRDWRYRLDLFGPSTSVTRSLPGESVLHVAINAASGSPWRGQSPVDGCPVSAGLIARIDRHEAHGFDTLPRVVFNAEPDQFDGGQHARLDDELDKIVERYMARGALGSVEPLVLSGATATFLAHATGEGVNDLRSSVERSILAACGIPPELAHGDADGTGRREAFRQFYTATLQPWLGLLAAEATVKLESPVTISARRIRAADITGRARAYASLTKAGMAPEQAAEAVGLED